MHIYFNTLKAKRLVLIGLSLILLLTLAACGKKSPEDLYKSAQQAMQRGDMITAMTSLNKIIKNSPDTEVAQEARWLLVEAYMQSNNKEKALTLLDEILERGGIASPKGKDALVARYQIWREDKEYDKIIADIAKTSPTLKNEPAFAWGVQFFLAQIYQESENTTKSLEILENLQESVKDDEQQYLRTLQQRAVILSLDKKYDAAMTLYENFLKEHPKTKFEYACTLNMGGIRMIQSETTEDETLKKVAKAQGEELYHKGIDIMTREMEGELVEANKITMAHEIATVYHQRLNDIPKAIDVLTSTLATYQDKTGMDKMNLMGRIGELHLFNDDFDQSQTWFELIKTEYSADPNIHQAATAKIQQIIEMKAEAEAEATSRTLMMNATAPTTATTIDFTSETLTRLKITSETMSLPAIMDAASTSTKNN